MRHTKTAFFALLLFAFAACQKDEATVPDPVNPTDPSMPTGIFAASRSGVFQKQNGYNAEGTAQIGTDEANVQWLRLAPDFNTTLSTGSVTVYLSKSQNLALGTSGSFQRLDLVTKPGEHFLKVDPALGNDFKFAIIWCAPAGVQFGNAELK